jgi:hypothetical protein
MKAELLAIRAINQYRRRDILASKYRTKNVGSREKEKNWVEKD